MFWVIILFILPLMDAKMKININVHMNTIDIDYSGNDDKVVTEKELQLFNITDERLNKGMRVELGQVPHDIFLKDPTPYGTLFKKYKWEELKRRVNVKKAKVIDILMEDVILNTHEHINKTPNNITSKRSMYKVVETTVASTWTKLGVPEDDIFYNLNINLGYGQFNYEHKWRYENIRTAYMPLGLTKEGKITIKPEQTVVTKLKASKMIILIELVYQARLIGSVIANYAHTYGKYHFWAPSVESIMKAADMRNDVLTTEILEIRCYQNPKLEVYDKLTGEVVEPPKKKRPLMKILRNKNMTRIIYVKTKKQKQQKKNL